jgi:serine/threonine-protein kinase
MPDNGKGFSFIRGIIVPATALFVIIAADKTLRVAGLHLIERVGHQLYTIVYTAGLLLTGIWISAAWLFNMHTLHRFFAPPPQPAKRKETALLAEDGCEPRHEEESGETQTATVILPTNGGPPTTLGRYKVLKEIGRGAMGVVYLGKDPTIQRFVAIKTMSLHSIEDAETLREEKSRFFREAESTGRLSHPNIVTIYDAGEELGLVYLAMEMLEGTTLKHWSRKPNLMPVNQLIPTFAAVADALDYAHQQGIIHRDIKPANIMVTNQQGVKVMDFGIAKMASSSRTQTNVVLGTPTYMSPEQITGKKVDGRSDIFSLGVVMFELLAGRPPFLADNVPALLYAIGNTPHPPLASIRADLSPALIAVVDRALHKDVAHRYRRAADIALDLRACMQATAA